MKTGIIVTTLIVGTVCQFTLGLHQARGADSALPAAASGGGAQEKRGPREVIQEKIRAAVAAKLAEFGAGCDEIQVTVAIERDSATPFKVNYRGLRNFKGNDGTAPGPDGSFVMEYKGGGEWQGMLAGTPFTAAVGAKDNINLPFVNDPQVIGEWESVDFVPDMAEFNPQQRAWQGKLYLKGLTFQENGKTPQPWWTWTKGFLIHHGDQTASHYEIRQTNGATYLFLEWKSGDVMIAGMKPHYYVLKPKTSTGTQ